MPKCALSSLFPKLATCNLHRKFIDNKVVSCWDAAMISRRAEVAQWQHFLLVEVAGRKREREREIERVAFALFSKSHLTFNLSFSKQLRLLIKNRWGAQTQHENNNKRWVSHHVAADPEPAEPVTKRRSAFKLKCIKPSKEATEVAEKGEGSTARKGKASATCRSYSQKQ